MTCHGLWIEAIPVMYGFSRPARTRSEPWRPRLVDPPPAPPPRLTTTTCRGPLHQAPKRERLTLGTNATEEPSAPGQCCPIQLSRGMDNGAGCGDSGSSSSGPSAHHPALEASRDSDLGGPTGVVRDLRTAMDMSERSSGRRHHVDRAPHTGEGYRLARWNRTANAKRRSPVDFKRPSVRTRR